MDWLAKHWELEAIGTDPIDAAEAVIKKFREQSQTGWWAILAKAKVTDVFTMALDNQRWMGRITFDLEFFEKRIL